MLQERLSRDGQQQQDLQQQQRTHVEGGGGDRRSFGGDDMPQPLPRLTSSVSSQQQQQQQHPDLARHQSLDSIQTRGGVVGHPAAMGAGSTALTATTRGRLPSLTANASPSSAAVVPTGVVPPSTADFDGDELLPALPEYENVNCNGGGPSSGGGVGQPNLPLQPLPSGQEGSHCIPKTSDVDRLGDVSSAAPGQEPLPIPPHFPRN